ncbi:DNA gyrase/topoisomerase IV subunit A [Acidiluteibacter ferrifornacis]|uniref:DNA gyrase/topoisomerase IV subunit A n=1 Tax=Acidiluteibacter ferrifornacis TaxID=2692424 RepID=A0A6N9NHU8_9FLAO|nr:DNA gyrase/topoisomerase IV subunit A [Acidiluteibacter ferrifornacis]NBG65412.1 DNA gyrase/topoisomerase IV subunit A [Acidiluteibacter ferrifornacis]
MAEDIDDPIEENNENEEEQLEATDSSDLGNVINVSGMYNEWFLDYASYVILERAVPHINDGLKPVQRRILHSLKELDDGRYHKVANVIGNTMKFHPHGDASIGDAMVQIGQKDLLLDCQGNWGNILTGDRAAAPRYIEVRLSKFALDVVFNAKTTEWAASYDSRGKEPVTLPVKFPLLLAQGVEGIAVGLACKMLPHNFNELIDSSIAILKNKPFTLLPDFQTGGAADFSNYNDGIRGGKVRVRAKISQTEKKSLVISEIPFGTNTSSLIDSIIKANDKGKIKIKNIEDNTSENVEINIYLPSGVSPDKTIDALYAFTDCEVSISPNSGVIENNKPKFLGVTEILKISTNQTKNLLQMELEIRKGELQEQWHFSSLEKIFIENRIYRDIEEQETMEGIIKAVYDGLAPFTKHLLRAVTDDDVNRLLEIRIKRISKFDSFKADELIKRIEDEIEEINHHLDNLVDYTIAYFKRIKEKYGKGRERKTEIKSFETIDATKVAVANTKLYVQRAEGFVGHGLKKSDAEFVADCSDIDDIIVFREDGKMMVTKISSKTFVGKNILHVAVWKKGDKRTIYNLVYQDGSTGPAMMKRFAVTSITRDKEYDLTAGSPKSKILYFSANPNGEAEVVNVQLRPRPKLKKLKFDLDFSELAIKGRSAKGNTVTKNIVSKIKLKEEGVSTLGARKIWFDDTVQRLNTEGRGELLGAFKAEDKILTVMQSGTLRLVGFNVSNHFEDDLILIEKWNPEKPLAAVYYDGEKKDYFVKRFLVEDTDKKQTFITEHSDSRLEIVSSETLPVVSVSFRKEKGKDERATEIINLNEFIAVKGFKALGNKLTPHSVKAIDIVPVEEAKAILGIEDEPEEEVVEEEVEGGESNAANPEEGSKESTEETMSTNKLTEQTESQKEKSRPPKKGKIIDPNEDTDNQISLF